MVQVCVNTLLRLHYFYLMKKQYTIPVITTIPVFVYGMILAGSGRSLSQQNSTSGLENTPGNGGQSDGSHSPGAKTGYVDYKVWEE